MRDRLGYYTLLSKLYLKTWWVIIPAFHDDQARLNYIIVLRMGFYEIREWAF